MTTDASATSTGTQSGFHRTLGLRDVIAQSLSVIAPAMSGAFLTYLASTKAGGATPLAFLLGTLAMLAVGGTVAMFARSLSSAGSMYTYITRGAGNRPSASSAAGATPRRSSSWAARCCGASASSPRASSRCSPAPMPPGTGSRWPGSS